MTPNDRFASVDEHIAQVSELGLSGLSNPLVDMETEHIAGGYIRSVFTFTKDFRIAGPTSGRRDVPIVAFRLGKTINAIIRAATFNGKVLLDIPAVTTILSYSLGSSPDDVDDLHAPTNSLFSSTTDTLKELSLPSIGTEGVVSFSTMYLNIVFVALAPSNGATILKGTKLVVIWLPLKP